MNFFDFICSQFLFFMTRVTTLPQIVNQNSVRFATYGPKHGKEGKKLNYFKFFVILN